MAIYIETTFDSYTYNHINHNTCVNILKSANQFKNYIGEKTQGQKP